MEKGVSFTCEGLRIAGTLHVPAFRGRRPAVVFCHGFTGDRVEAHGIFVKTARRLERAGVASLRFDFRGSGESGGDFKDMSVGGEVRDAVRALDFLRRRAFVDPRRLAFLGLSLGAAVACCALRLRPVGALVLWSPLAQTRRLFTLPTGFSPGQVRRWAQRGFIDYHGYRLGAQWREDLGRHDPLEGLSAFKGKALVVQGSRDRATPLSQARLYLKTLGTRARFHLVRGADHTFNRADWESEAIRATVRWLVRNL